MESHFAAFEGLMYFKTASLFQSSSDLTMSNDTPDQSSQVAPPLRRLRVPYILSGSKWLNFLRTTPWVSGIILPDCRMDRSGILLGTSLDMCKNLIMADVGQTHSLGINGRGISNTRSLYWIVLVQDTDSTLSLVHTLKSERLITLSGHHDFLFFKLCYQFVTDQRNMLEQLPKTWHLVGRHDLAYCGTDVTWKYEWVIYTIGQHPYPV